MRDRLPHRPGPRPETRLIVTTENIASAAATDVEAPQAPGSEGTAPAVPAHVEYSAGVVRLGDIPGLSPEPEATPDITDEDGSTRDLDQKSFADFGVSDPIVDALAARGITHPFPIQALTLPVALTRHDIIGQAKTGTGKTLGFGIPLLEDVIAPDEDGYADLLNPGSPQALVVLPTRELTKQVATDLRAAAAKLSTRIVDIYGGVAFEPQIEALERGVDVVVGTPGRLIDLLRRGYLHLGGVQTVVLDEADEMLDLGFLPDVETLLSRVPATRHTMLFSATMPGPVVALARRFMTHPTHIRAQDPSDTHATVNTVKQVIYRVHAMNKVEVVARILQARGRGRTIIFCRTKRTAARLGDDLSDRGFAVGALHGDLGQGAREQAMRAFRNGKIDVLVATDVAARGIDVDDVTHVINYQCPEDEKIYIHRIGRTGRAGHSGTAVTFVDWDDVPRWSLISRALGLGVPEPLETYHTSPHLYTDLDIPADVTDRLPLARRTLAGLDAEVIEDLGETGGHHGDRDLGGRVRRSAGGRGRGGRGIPGGRGRAPSERTRASRTEQENAAGQQGRSDRGSRGRGRGDHTPEPRTPADDSAAPRRRRRRRRSAGGSGGSAPASEG
ncbi:MAG: DEAD/DEAH box helicase [Actinomyces sp.]|jgi:superfamily II DNA/RNA helicase|nr:DEAD/DEAH box helicase [Actinomyces sp.]MCI1642136.1 DEAD/DEAH box helicase [Actinomyces sp.]MCI1662410.1 DEAD/DEAH box helicase [Actinomyces sp.]MCI1691234.1 DEAD/DEAH box helicase [Actinomyces sp.]MCI1788078.1 DEAD/DEAH box helicase [Actinomyces sp.]MCI1830471.1 DEAD/DEAH box helicase [Actinomyces sp.]